MREESLVHFCCFKQCHFHIDYLFCLDKNSWSSTVQLRVGRGKNNITRILCLPPSLSQLFSSCKTARLRSDRGFYFSSQMQKCSCFSSLAAERVGESLWESLSKHCHTTQSLTATCKVLDMTSRFTVASGVMEALLFCRC